MNPYSEQVEKHMQRYYESLSEKDRRRYAAVEAEKLGHGGITYVSQLLKCSPNTIKIGLAELDDEQILSQTRIRQEGGGRKSVIENNQELELAFLQIIDQYTAGSPMDQKIKWTYLNQRELTQFLKEQGFQISEKLVVQLLEKHKFRKRKAKKVMSAKECIDRDDQFKNIAKLKEDYQTARQPVISMDSKKKSL